MEDEEDGGGYGHPSTDFVEHSQQQFQCEVCGSSHFYNDGGGTYFCATCQTQSQESRQFVEEDLALRAGNIRQALTTSASGAASGSAADRKKAARIRKRKAKVVLTNWEVYNHVLKAMTEELIRMGFPSLLRAKVFQLWSAYLVRRGVLGADTYHDWKEQRKAGGIPCISAHEAKQNLVKLFNQPWGQKEFQFRSREFKGMRDFESKTPTHSLSAKKRIQAITRRKAFESQYGSQPEGALDNQATTVTSSPASAAGGGITEPRRAGIRHRFTKPASILRSIYWRTKMQSLAPNYKGSFKRAPKEHTVFRRLLKPEVFSCLQIFVLLFVALRQIGCRVLFTDILRLIDDGTLWVESLRTVLGPEEYSKVDASCDNVLNTIHKFRNPLQLLDSIEMFNRYIGLRRFHFPTFEEFLPKFIDELALPREFECLLLQIDKMYPLNEDLLEIRCPRPRWKYVIEIPIVCRIGTFLRMLFAFDDITERHQSKFAETVNRVMEALTKKNEPRVNSDWSKLFVIEDWFRFMRYRRRIVAAETYNSKLSDPTKPPNLTRLQEIITRYGNTKESNVAHPSPQVRANVKHYFSTVVAEVHDSIPEVPNYATVQSANDAVFQTYLSLRPSNVSYPEYKNEELLNMNFSRTRVDWIWNPQKYVPLLEKAGYKVKVVAGDARQYKEPIMDDFLYVFQPYKCFDDFLDENSASFSLRFLLDALKTAIGPGFSLCEGHYRHDADVISRNLFYFCELYCKRAHGNVIPLIH